jgi:pimeloyl-ACP methyl ester carboxylesterase
MTSSEAQTVISRAGLKLAVERAGAPDAPTVVLLHGGGQTRHSWRKAMGSFVAAGYSAISYDARGHGDSEWSPSGDYAFSSLSSDLDDVLATGSGPFVLIGASMGGMTAFRCAATSLRPIVGLVLVDIVPRPARAGAERILAFMRSHRDGFATVDDAADAVTAYYPERERPSDVRGLRKNLRARDDGRLYWHWDPRLIGDEDRPEPHRFAEWAFAAAPNIGAPVLLVRGGLSDLIDDEGVSELRTILPQTEVLNVPGAGHMLVGDRNDAFNEGVIAFTRRHMPLR